MSQGTPPFDVNTARAVLGIRRPVPITLPEMVRSLKVTFVPGTRVTPRLQTFGDRLRKAFREAGVREIPFSTALTTGERLMDGVVPISVGRVALIRTCCPHSKLLPHIQNGMLAEAGSTRERRNGVDLA